MEIKWIIKGIDCANCSLELEREISKIAGITFAKLNFMMERLTIRIEEEKDKENIVKMIDEIIKDESDDIEIEEI